MSKDLVSPVVTGSKVTPQGTVQYTYEGGLTLRQHFAGLAMQGLLPTANKSEIDWGDTVAEASVILADKIIEELNGTPSGLYTGIHMALNFLLRETPDVASALQVLAAALQDLKEE